MDPWYILLMFFSIVLGWNFGKLLIALLVAISEKSRMAAISIVALTNIVAFFFFFASRS